MRALLLVDIQNDFMPSGRLPVAEGDAIIEPVNRIIGGYPLVVASQDWHPAGHESFASAHAGKKPFDVINLHGLEQVLWPDHCIAGSSGAAFHPELNTTPIAAVFRKGMDKHTDSYSAFYDNGRRRSTQLAAYLRAHGVTDIDVAGLAADFCVYFSMARSPKAFACACSSTPPEPSMPQASPPKKPNCWRIRIFRWPISFGVRFSGSLCVIKGYLKNFSQRRI